MLCTCKDRKKNRKILSATSRAYKKSSRLAFAGRLLVSVFREVLLVLELVAVVFYISILTKREEKRVLQDVELTTCELLHF